MRLYLIIVTYILKKITYLNSLWTHLKKLELV